MYKFTEKENQNGMLLDPRVSRTTKTKQERESNRSHQQNFV